MSWEYGKAENGNEMETGNGNWKQKLETEIQTNNAPITGAIFSLYSLLKYSI